jgi:hypothetical protein
MVREQDQRVGGAGGVGVMDNRTDMTDWQLDNQL